MKRIVGGFLGVGLMLAIVGGGCAYSGLDTAKRILGGRFENTNLTYKTFKWCTNGLPFVDRLEQVLGGKYVILLQNNMELRATGGFAGSYAVVETDKKGVEQIRVQDIYEPDGKLPGHVEPPYPVQEAFGQGWWKLRDANWDPDFASAAATERWFFEHGGETDIAGMAAVNLDLVNKFIGIFGPISLATYPETVTEKNFYYLAQTYAETRRPDDTTDKRGFLAAVGAALEERIKSFEVGKWLKLVKVVGGELKKGEILVWMRDPEIQKEIEFRKWGGRLTGNWDPSTHSTGSGLAGSGQADYLYIVETNLGANKANCCIERKVRFETETQTKEQKIAIKWRNNNEFENPKPPVFWGGNYIDYVRVIIPKAAKVQSLKVAEKELRWATDKDFVGPNALRKGRSENIYVVEERGDLQTIGFWAVVEAKKDLRVEIEIENPNKYDKLLLKHQPGSGVTSYQILVDGVIKTNGQLDRDKEVVIE